MTKQHATRKTINNRFSNVYATGYCSLQYLLRAFQPSYCNAGTFGWNWYAHIVDYDTVIVTGYRNTTGQYIPYEISEKYNNLAKAVCENSKLNWDETKAQLETLMAQMLEELKEG